MKAGAAGSRRARSRAVIVTGAGDDTLSCEPALGGKGGLSCMVAVGSTEVARPAATPSCRLRQRQQPAQLPRPLCHCTRP